MKSLSSPFSRPLWLSLAVFGIVLCSRPCQALSIVGGMPEGYSSMSEGVAVGNDGKAYLFITPRHFIGTHDNITASSFSGINVSAIGGHDLSGSNVAKIWELESDLPGITPLSILEATSSSQVTSMTLRIFGNGTGFAYGSAVTSPTPTFVLNDDRDGTGSHTVNLLDTDGTTTDMVLWLDYRSINTTLGTGIVVSGDSHSAVVADIGGTLYGLGSALGIVDVENPYYTTSIVPAYIDAAVFPFLGFYRPEIESYLAARSVALGSTYQASFSNPFSTLGVPEPTRAALSMIALALLGVGRRKR